MSFESFMDLRNSTISSDDELFPVDVLNPLMSRGVTLSADSEKKIFQNIYSDVTILVGKVSKVSLFRQQLEFYCKEKNK